MDNKKEAIRSQLLKAGAVECFDCGTPNCLRIGLRHYKEDGEWIGWLCDPKEWLQNLRKSFKKKEEKDE